MVSQNVSGLCDPHWKLLVKTMSTILHQLHIIMLQELKANDFRLTSALFAIANGYKKLILFLHKGRWGTTLLIHPDLIISNNDTFATDSTIWATLSGSHDTFNFASLYAPNTPSSRSELWLTLTNNLSCGDWIVDGDFNCTKSPVNSTTHASLLCGREQEEWRALKSQIGLVDIFNMIHSPIGSRFTWR